MAAIKEINQALVEAVIGGSFGLDIAFENIKFDPKAKTSYLALHNLRAPTVVSSLGQDGCDLHSGLLQIDINYPQGGGIDDLLGMADTINAVFKNGAVFDGPVESVKIDNVSAQPVVIAGGWATISLSIEYYSYTRRL